MITTTKESEAARLHELAALIEDWGKARGMSFAALRRATDGQIGSDRQWGRILAGESVDVEDWVPRYEAAWALLEARTDAPEGEPIYDDLTLPRCLRVAVSGVMRSTGLDRVVIATAPSGMGKTRAANLARERLGARAVWAEADPTWTQAPAMLAGLARALGHREPPDGAARCLAIVRERLQSGRTALFIDEAHHLGPNTLDVVKTLVNQTPGEFILLAIPSLWRKLEAQSYEQARQLVRNRLYERIVLDALPLADATRVIERRVPALQPKELKTAARMYCAKSGHQGRNLALLVAVCREMTVRCEGESAPGAALFAEALHSVEARR
jgi:hypothetical protein